MNFDPDPKEALASIQATRDAVSAVPKYPFSYDLLYGFACALLVASQGMPQPWSLLVLPVALGALAVMVAAWRRRFGWWVNGYSPRRARWVAIGLATVLVALIGLSLYGRYGGIWWLFLVSGGIGFFVSIFGSRLWMAVWRGELAEHVR